MPAASASAPAAAHAAAAPVTAAPAPPAMATAPSAPPAALWRAARLRLHKQSHASGLALHIKKLHKDNEAVWYKLAKPVQICTGVTEPAQSWKVGKSQVCYCQLGWYGSILSEDLISSSTEKETQVRWHACIHQEMAHGSGCHLP